MWLPLLSDSLLLLIPEDAFEDAAEPEEKAAEAIEIGVVAEAQKAQPEPIDPEQEKFEVMIEARHLYKSYTHL